MNNIDETKRPYTLPTIVRVELDNEISLALASAPPSGPNESSLIAPEYFNNDPFKTNVG